MTTLENRLEALRAAGRTSMAHGPGLGAIALEKTAADPERIVVIEGGRAVSRAEMLQAALNLGGALTARGLQPGAAIGFQLPNWWEACVINLAASLFGYRIVPLLTIYRSAELSTMLPLCGVEALFVPETFRGKDFPALIADLPAPPRLVITLRDGAKGELSFDRLIRHAPGTPALAENDDIKMILFTSGTTGGPKGVLHSHASIDAVIRMAAGFWGIGADDRLYVPSPIAHIGGSIYAFEFPWITDCAAVLAESWDPDRAVADIEAHGATFMAGATPFLRGLIEASGRAGTRLPGLRRFICGGAQVPPELILEGLAHFPDTVVSRAYGSSEVPLVCPGITTREDAAAHAGTDGYCEAELRILGADGDPVANGQSGEIAVRSPRMFLGYLDARDDEGAFIADGFFMMGDLGRRLEGGYLEITGRSKDIIIRKGENLSPLEIENALARHLAIRQSAVVGIPDPERGELVVAFVILRDGAGFDFAEMTAHLDRLGLARQKFPERLETVETLPLNTIGKVVKTELRRWAIERNAAPAPLRATNGRN
ncbi:AMP-binding protein [Martelella soudanensis]|uniref:AMP-binding protein n=1 Tax=unclassified Martelella TaxID=2629616 RepID=UPI0015DE7A9E|nr:MULTISPECIES: AMP-binding protein [unclassified Martelella]